MFGWIFALGAGICCTTVGGGIAGKIYGEYKAGKSYEKKTKRFYNKVNRELKILNEKYNPKEETLCDEKSEKKIQLSKTSFQQQRIKYFSQPDYYFSAEEVENEIKEAEERYITNVKNNIDVCRNNIVNTFNSVFIDEKQSTAIESAIRKIKNIKSNVLNRPASFDDIREIYNIFAKKTWLMEKKSPNIVRNDDFLIKEIMQEICKKDISDKSKSLLEVLLSDDVILNTTNESQEVGKYKVFFDFLSQYSGIVKDNVFGKWKEEDCVLVEEFIKDKQFDMYEDIEALPECVEKIVKIYNIMNKNLIKNNTEKITSNIETILDERCKSLSKQLEKIKTKDENIKNNKNMKNAINGFITK